MYSYDWNWSELWINLFLKRGSLIEQGGKKQVSSKGNSMHMSSVKNKEEKVKPDL